MRALFFSAKRTHEEGESRSGDVSKGGVWLRRLVTGAIANSPVPGSDSAIAPVARLARHPLSTMPPDLLPFLALALQDRKKTGTAVANGVLYKTGRNDAAPGIPSTVKIKYLLY